MWDSYTILDKLATIIAYILLPITYPIYLYNDRKHTKKVLRERKEREEREKLRQRYMT